MRVLIVSALLSIALAVCTAPATAQTCNETFFSAASQDSQLNLLATAVSALSPSNNGIIPSPAEGITVFAPTDDALLAFLGDQGLTLASAAGLGDQLVAILLQHVLLNATTLDQLVQQKSVQSVLGAVLNASYPITATNTSGKVQVSGKANPKPANVLKTTKICTSYVYDVDTVLEPAAKISTVPNVTLAQATAFESAASGSPAGSTSPMAAPTTAAPSPAPAPQGAARASSLAMRGSLAGLLAFAAVLAVN